MKYTLKTFADEYNLKKQTVYARFNKLKKKYANLDLAEKVGNKLFLTDTGLKLLKQNIQENPILNNISENIEYEQIRITPDKQDQTLISDHSPINADNADELLSLKEQIKTLNNIIDRLNAENERLQEQLLNKDKQISELHDLLDNMLNTFKQSLNESHILALDKQNTKQITAPDQAPDELDQEEYTLDQDQSPEKKKKKKKIKNKKKKSKNRKSGFVGIKR